MLSLLKDCKVDDMKKNYYASLCTEVYELLHKETPLDELNFYLSYAKKDQKILEALCGSGRFLIPFLNEGFDIEGIDSSKQMLDKLVLKRNDAIIYRQDVLNLNLNKKYDYIFITSGSVSLFTDVSEVEKLFLMIKNILLPGGKFVFAVDTIKNKEKDDTDYVIRSNLKLGENRKIIYKSKNHFDSITNTQFYDSIYELYENDALIQNELMDFQTHLYSLDEIKTLLSSSGFKNIKAFKNFNKDEAIDDDNDMLLLECTNL